MRSELKQEIMHLMDEMPKHFAELPGEVFSTGAKSLARGDFYLAGVNPMAGQRYPSIRSHVANWDLYLYSAFLDQCWEKECWNRDCYGFQNSLDCKHGRGRNRHQVAVRNIMERASPGFDLKTLFATNAVFASSASAQGFSTETGLTLLQAFEACWPLHQYFLRIVRPRFILCLGYQDSGSAFWLLKRKAVRGSVEPLSSHKAPGRKFASFKSARMMFDSGAGELSTVVVGVRHPSYVPDAANTAEFSELIAELGCQR